MNGAESLIRTLVDSGVDTCFTNPGTSEMHFVAALDQVTEMKAVLALFEGVATGAADGYGRMAQRPAATLLHLGPGLANGLANLHNARRAATPVVNIVGDHATYHAQHDAPLTSDLEGFARPVSGWMHTSMSSRSIGSDAARAVAASKEHPGQVATLILPADTAWSEAEGSAGAIEVAAPPTAATDVVDRIAAILRTAGDKAAVLIRGNALVGPGLEAAGRLAAATGARLMCDTFTPRQERGAGRVALERIPYFGEQVVDHLDAVEHLILVGSKPPVSFFAYPDKPSWLTPRGCEIHVLTHPHEHATASLEALAEVLNAPVAPARVSDGAVPGLGAGPLDAMTVGQSVAHLLPEGAIISDEAATSGIGFAIHADNAAPHDVLSLTGGAIGQGMPVATGAAIACPNRKVVCLHGDGGAMYTVQALWTQAREQLDVTTVIFSNRAYAILSFEMYRVGAKAGPVAQSMFDLSNPDLDWVKLAEGMGVQGNRVDTIEQFNRVFAAAMAGTGPHLIEVAL